MERLNLELTQFSKKFFFISKFVYKRQINSFLKGNIINTLEIIITVSFKEFYLNENKNYDFKNSSHIFYGLSFFTVLRKI